MDRLTKQDIEAVWSDVYRAYEQHTPNIYPEAIARLRAPFDLALQSLGLESERSEALPNVEEIPEYFAKPGITEGLANAHPTLLVRQMANEILRLRALSPARVAEGQCVYPEECKALGRCIKPEDHDNPSPCKPPESPARVAEGGTFNAMAFPDPHNRTMAGGMLGYAAQAESTAKEQPGEQDE